MKWSKISLS